MKGLGDKARLLASLLCAILALSLIAAPVLAAPGGDVLTVGVPADRCPVFYRDADTGEIVGIGADLMRAAAQEAGYAVTFRVVTESTLKEALDNEAYDLVMPFGSAIASASGRATVVSENLMQTPFILVTENRRDMPQLNELRVGMLHSLGGGAETVRELFPGIEITMFATMDESVKALRAGEVDALMHNSFVWSYVLQKPSYADLTVQPATMFSMDFRAGTPDTPEGRALIERLNEGIASLTDTRRQAVALDYTSRRLYRYDASDYLYQYGTVMLFSVLLVVAMILFTLQRQRAIRLEHEKKLRELIDHDPLTGLLSMNGFRKRVEELMRQNPGAHYFLSYNNIRDFKFINYSLGRVAGDDLLRFWAARSMEHLMDDEAIGRIEADHFAVLRRIEGEEQMRADEENVLEPVANFFIHQGKENKVLICSGVYVLTPEDYQKVDVDHMLDLARLAERRTRDSREEPCAFYNPEQWEKEKRVADVVNYLPFALRSGDIQVWYQPQVNYATGAITGAEALCRWDHSKQGFLQPAAFIETLEETGLIYDLDSYVWERVCQDLRRWNDQGIRRTVSVNVSRCDIREGRDIPGHFHHLVRLYGLSPEQLRIEFTETAYVENPDILIRTTEKLRSYGFRVEMDDFGSGYSSLHMLKEVPVDRIKLDLHFLTDTGDSEKCRIIVSHMIRMVRALGMELIAEGVETVEQAEFLQSWGSSDMQGYYFYKPMPVQEFEQLDARV